MPDNETFRPSGGMGKVNNTGKATMCKGRTVIRHSRDHRDPDMRGQPILDENNARQYRPCEAWSANGTEYCIAHGGATPAAISAAKRTIALATPNAAEVLSRLLMDESVPPETRIKAATQLLDRGGIRSGVDVGLDAPKWQGILGRMFGTPVENAIEDVLEPPAEEPTPVAKPAKAKPSKAPARRTKPKPASAKADAKPKFEGW